MSRISPMRAVFAATIGAALLAAAPAHAQFTNSLTGRQFGTVYGANADFIMSQMIRNAGWQAMRASIQRSTGGSTRAPAAAPPRAAAAAPLSASDFRPAGPRNVPEQFAALGGSPEDRAQILKACRDLQRAIEAEPGFRPNNVASAMALVIVVGVKVGYGVDLTDRQSDEVLRGVNDALAALPAFGELTPAERTRLYDTFVITGALIAGIAQAAVDAGDAGLQAQARAMARDVLAAFGLGA
ncbi:MAG: DUF6683 family protein [Burkholderiales bacterium]